MTSKVHRKPIGNFFIKKSLQIRLIKKIVIAALISTLVSTGSLILVYYLKYQTVIVYQLDKLTQELNREHIVFLILPTLLVSALVSVFVSFGIGLYSSRKYAVPIYKLEQWATLLRSGKLNALLRFREKEEMKELSDKCNQLATEFRQRFQEIKKQADELKENEATTAAAANLENILLNLDLTMDPIEVNTGFYTVAKEQLKEEHPKST
jgi:nitrogen fixation/metabolism regulation signal transduction histidine kinase